LLLLGGEAGAPAPLHFLSKFAHGLLRDILPLSARKRSFSFVDSSEYFQSPPLAFFP
jgi:hypothetical protein